MKEDQIMRKSERLRVLEIQVARMELIVELYTQTINNLLDSQGMEINPLDSGKWYQRKPQENN